MSEKPLIDGQARAGGGTRHGRRNLFPHARQIPFAKTAYRQRQNRHRAFTGKIKCASAPKSWRITHFASSRVAFEVIRFFVPILKRKSNILNRPGRWAAATHRAPAIHARPDTRTFPPRE